MRLLLLLLLLTACNAPSTSTFSDTRMCIGYKVIIGEALTASQTERVQAIIDETFDNIDNTFNEWNPASEVSRFNATHSDQPLSPQLKSFLDTIDKIVTLTKGRFDPTAEPLVKLWKDKLSQNELPTEDELEKIKEAIGWQRIHYSEETLSKEHPKTALTFGGIAKGLLVDNLTENLQKAGFKNLYVEWGGEIRTLGQHPQKRPWRILITRLGTPESAVDTLELNNQAVATSGSYYQSWSINDITYTHIIDTETLHPLPVTPTRPRSVTVVADSCTLADALATSAMMFEDITQARAWAQEIEETFPNTQFWLFAKDLL